MGWLIGLIFAAGGWLTWTWVTDPKWQQKYILQPWRQEAEIFRCQVEQAKTYLARLQQIRLRADRAAPLQNIDRALHQQRRQLAARLNELARLPLDELARQAQHPPDNPAQRLRAFLRWRWHTANASPHLAAIAQIQEQILLLHRQLTQTQNAYRRRLRDLLRKLGRLSVPTPEGRRFYLRMMEHINTARQDIRDRYGIGLWRAGIILNVLELSWDALSISNQGQSLSTQVELNLLAPQIAEAAVAARQLLALPLPDSPSALAQLEDHLHPLSAQLSAIKQQIARLQYERTQFASNTAWLRKLSQDEHLPALRNSARQQLARCQAAWGPPAPQNEWWQQALAEGNPLEISNSLFQSVRAALQDSQQPLNEGQITAFNTRCETLRQRIQALDRSQRQLRETYQRYQQHRNALRDLLEEDLPLLLSQQGDWLQRIKAPRALRQEYEHQQRLLEDLQSTAMLPPTPERMTHLQEQAQTLQEDIKNLTYKARAQLMELQDSLRRAIIRFDEKILQLEREMQIAPRPLPDCCQADRLVRLNQEADTWRLDDDFHLLHIRQEELKNAQEQADYALTSLNKRRTQLKRARQRAHKLTGQLQQLETRIQRERQNASWHLLFDDYAELEEEVQNWRQKLQTREYQPDSAVWLDDAIRDLEETLRQADDRIQIIRERLRQLALDEQRYRETGAG